MATKIHLARHAKKSDHGSDAYTVWPDGAICTGLKPAHAALLNAAQDMQEVLKRVLTELSPNKYVSDELLDRIGKVLDKSARTLRSPKGS